MKEISLSYLMVTKNKLPYFKESIQKLIKEKKEDEEILVADGGSSDGTGKFLFDLKERGMIDYCVSEPDFGEAHALNKLSFAAKGKLITIVTDDDVFHYPTIRAMKEFMRKHPEIDMVGPNGGFKNSDTTKSVRPFYYEDNYREWQKNHTPFAFCCLALVYRRSSLSLLGLWNPAFKKLDAEFSLRNTSGKANVAWYTGHAYVNISTPQSTSLVYMKRIKDETDFLDKFYLGKNPDPFVIEKFKVLRNKLRSGSFFKQKQSPIAMEEKRPKLVTIAEEWLEKINKEKKLEFIQN
ncbi:MAG: glycosyltransferase [Patescibacteria group bacterium]|nr:glycosyltransferase [bacterium]MDZ4240718.1 glycosyltransferase [Patescibacteria group bacterium]